MALLKLIVKIFVSIALLVILFYKTDIRLFLTTITSIGLLNFLLLSAIYIFSQIISSIRWHFVLKSLGENVKSIELLKIYFIGMYANLFLPSIIGGDALKAYILSKKIPLNKSISSIFLERYNGLLALLFVSLISVTLFKSFFKKEIVIMVIAINIFAYFSVYSIKFFTKYSKKLEIFFNNIKTFHKSKYFISVSILSLFVQLIVISVYITAGNMLGFRVNYAYYLAFIPIINLISFLPISFNGIGVRESAFVLFFSLANLNKTQSLTLSLEVFFVTVFCSLIGGIIYLVQKSDYKKIARLHKSQSIN